MSLLGLAGGGSQGLGQGSWLVVNARFASPSQSERVPSAWRAAPAETHSSGVCTSTHVDPVAAQCRLLSLVFAFPHCCDPAGPGRCSRCRAVTGILCCHRGKMTRAQGGCEIERRGKAADCMGTQAAGCMGTQESPPAPPLARPAASARSGAAPKLDALPPQALAGCCNLLHLSHQVQVLLLQLPDLPPRCRLLQLALAVEAVDLLPCVCQ